jgi:hypothetical protein
MTVPMTDPGRPGAEPQATGRTAHQLVAMYWVSQNS